MLAKLLRQQEDTKKDKNRDKDQPHMKSWRNNNRTLSLGETHECGDTWHPGQSANKEKWNTCAKANRQKNQTTLKQTDDDEDDDDNEDDADDDDDDDWTHTS